ncbi:uncharacterized protein N7477_000676 [Penicillium maclennaniae]|uniref:uncharacterized protein n=1 Tax=Penicillium maclennaniae TaxID=1343394 RepID=UPI002541A218|nr:uncharacterized protein N7477_000676 [Penicillium maclennaniae]KAJ5684331.1 hypothetical protein N7477_000676 [Penicillium maclennaniae]
MIDPFVLEIGKYLKLEKCPAGITKSAIGWYETARLQNRLIHQFQDADHISENTITDLVSATIELCRLINSLINQLHEAGSLVDKASQSSDREPFNSMKNATPQSNPDYYNDRMEDNVVAWWNDLTLVLLRSEAIITLQKPLLSPPDHQNPSSQASWHSMAELCLKYLQLFAIAQKVPTWEARVWFDSAYYCPEQCALLILIYLKNRSHSENKQEMVTCLNDFLTHRSQTRPQWTGQDTLSMKNLGHLWEQLDAFSDDRRSTQSNDNYSTTPYARPGYDAISRVLAGQQEDRAEELPSHVKSKGYSSLESDDTIERIFQRWFP